MKVKVPDYDGDSPGGLVERDVPDEPIQKFVNYLTAANRYTYENNPEIVVEKANRLRLELIAAARKPLPPSSGTAEITVAGLLALCDCDTVEQLVDKVASDDSARVDWLDEQAQRVEELFGDLVNADQGETIRQLIDAARLHAPAESA